jgi:hypothetical protein
MWPSVARRRRVAHLAGTVLAVVLAGTPIPALAQAVSPPPGYRPRAFRVERGDASE